MSYLTQMAGLAYHNFASAAVGIALAIAFIRGISRREKETIGNFWVDLTRTTLWVLLPACIVYALVLVSQGVVQNLKPYDTVKLVEPQQVQRVTDGKPVVGPDGKPVMDTVTDQVIAQGPVASQEAIKMLGTNGGGFFNANSSHPFENPTPLSNYLQMISIFAIPAGLTYTLGRMTGSQRHGWAVWAAMAILFVAGVTTAYWAEARGNPLLKGVDQHASVMQSGGNMEGKEVRFGIADSTLFATITTDASCGAINGWHDSFTPLGGMVPLANIMLSETVFGGVGAGLYGILIYVVLSVFIAGLMVGRTPEYLGKKIEAYDVKMAMLVTLVFPFVILVLAGISSRRRSRGTATPRTSSGTRTLRSSASSALALARQSFEPASLICLESRIGTTRDRAVAWEARLPNTRDSTALLNPRPRSRSPRRAGWRAASRRAARAATPRRRRARRGGRRGRSRRPRSRARAARARRPLPAGRGSPPWADQDARLTPRRSAEPLGEGLPVIRS